MNQKHKEKHKAKSNTRILIKDPDQFIWRFLVFRERTEQPSTKSPYFPQ